MAIDRTRGLPTEDFDYTRLAVPNPNLQTPFAELLTHFPGLRLPQAYGLKAIPSIIGGMGPDATDYYAHLLTQQVRSYLSHAEGGGDRIQPIIRSSKHPFSDRTQLILTGTFEEQATLAGQFVLCIKEEFCSVARTTGLPISVVLPCNTAHYYVDLLFGEITLPGHEYLHTQPWPQGIVVLHMVQLASHEASQVASAADERRVAVFATDGTVKTNLYGRHLEAFGIEASYPGSRCQASIMQVIYNETFGVKSTTDGLLLRRGAEILAGVFNEVIESGVTTSLLACTELPISVQYIPGIEHDEFGRYIYKGEQGRTLVLIDPMEACARAQCEHMYGIGRLSGLSNEDLGNQTLVMNLLLNGGDVTEIRS
jgi:aspartate racemase